jgi:hypothetical protein
MRDASAMRTTLDLDEDVLQSVKELAEAQRSTVGKVTSQLVRRALDRPQSVSVRNGVPLFPKRPPGSPRPTMKRVNELRDSE